MRRPFVLNFAAFSRHIFEENKKHRTQIIGLLFSMQIKSGMNCYGMFLLLLQGVSILFVIFSPSKVQSCECFEEEQPVECGLTNLYLDWQPSAPKFIYIYCRTSFQNTECKYIVYRVTQKKRYIAFCI